MASIRLTLVNNADQSQRTVVVFSSHPAPFAAVLVLAQNKLRIRKASKIFTARGNPLDPDFCSSILANGDVLFVSSGEAFVGTVEPEQAERGVVRVIATEAPVEPQALEQLRGTAGLEGMRLVVGMPDLHPGQQSTGCPIGAVFVSAGRIFPKLIGGDIGCGMALYSTSVKESTSSRMLAQKLHGMEGRYNGEVPASIIGHLAPSDFDSSLGTIGGGNHFAELQRVVEVRDEETFQTLGLSLDRLALLVHSGSRGFGQQILRNTPYPFIAVPSSPSTAPSPELSTYLSQHEHACSWSFANRELIAHRFLTALNATATKVLDVWHNNVEKSMMRLDGEEERQEVWIHRKGAAPSDRGPLVVPGSRGTRSYVVMPEGDQEMNGRSVAHGAGRLWDRGKAREKGEKRFGKTREGKETLRVTKLGSHVVCEDDELLLEEVPEAYKDVDAVVQDLVDAGLVRIVAILEPVVTYKTRNEFDS